MRTITHAIDTRPFSLPSVLSEKKRPGNEATLFEALQSYKAFFAISILLFYIPHQLCLINIEVKLIYQKPSVTL